VSAAEAYRTLRRIGRPTVTTREAAAALGVSTSSASRALRTLSDRGLAYRIRHGLWGLGEEDKDPAGLASEITRPYPSYLSFASALAAHGAIDQIPREISLASTGQPKRVRTEKGTFVVHRLPASLFGGYETKDGVAIATPEKAVFDFVYVSQASGRPHQRLPELDLPRGFSRRAITRWTNRIPSPRLKRLVAAGVARALEHAV
jgi:predicted transcriptional regulator of viral defense system